MKKSLILTFAISLIVGLALVASDWIRRSQWSDETEALSLPAPLSARSLTVSHDETAPAMTQRWETSDKLLSSQFSEARTSAAKLHQKISDGSAATNNAGQVPGGMTGSGISDFSSRIDPDTNVTTQLSPTEDGVSASAQAPRHAPLPLAFRELPSEVAAANPQLVAALGGLQQSFIASVGGSNQDPNDSAYYERWITAQRNIDEQYRLLVGNQAFLAQQIKINSQQAQ